MIKLNGTTITTPDGYNLSIEDIIDGERNANGTLIADKIAQKRKISLQYSMLSADDYQDIMDIINNNFFFEVEYIDPQENGAKTGTFYPGGRSADGILYKNGKISWWQNVKFNLIEQ